MMQGVEEYTPVPILHHHHNQAQQHHNGHVDASRPSLGFPLGTGLLLIMIFSLIGVFSCCYHWDKFRSLRLSFSHSHDIEAALHHPRHRTSPLPHYSLEKGSKEMKERESVPVIMAGDEVPKFIALPCPCQPLRPQNSAPAPPSHDSQKPP